MWKRGCLLVLLVACGTCGTDDEEDTTVPSTACERLRDHLVDLRMADVKGVDVEPHKEAMKQAMGASFLATCAKDLSSSQLSCAIASSDLGAAAQCMASTTQGGSR